MNPLFKVGEEVILCSEIYPELDGEYFVLGVIGRLEHSLKYPSFKDIDSYSYDLGFTFGGNVTGCPCSHIQESSLRKKHKPSEYKFSELMTELDTELLTEGDL